MCLHSSYWHIATIEQHSLQITNLCPQKGSLKSERQTKYYSLSFSFHSSHPTNSRKSRLPEKTSLLQAVHVTQSHLCLFPRRCCNVLFWMKLSPFRIPSSGCISKTMSTLIIVMDFDFCSRANISFTVFEITVEVNQTFGLTGFEVSQTEP